MHKLCKNDITKEPNITTSLDTSEIPLKDKFHEIQRVPFPTTSSHGSIHQNECSDKHHRTDKLRIPQHQISVLPLNIQTASFN